MSAPSCLTGKVAYATRKEARTAANAMSDAWVGHRLKRGGKRAPRKLSPYRCKHGDHWHLTGGS